MTDAKKPPPIPGTTPAEKQTLVEEGTRLKGSLTSTCAVLVQGSIEGTIEGPAITVSKTGAVSGKITAGSLKSDGKIAGEFDVDTAQLAGTVAHDTVIRAASLDLKLDVATGKVQLKFGPAATNGPRGRS